jgi:hypothetical protein
LREPQSASKSLDAFHHQGYQPTKQQLARKLLPIRAERSPKAKEATRRAIEVLELVDRFFQLLMYFCHEAGIFEGCKRLVRDKV